MKAVVLNGYGGVDRLEIRDLPDPVPGPNEIAVRVAAAGINPIDWMLRSGALHEFMPLRFPAVLGRDVSGVVSAVGPGVTKFSVGARVLGLLHGGYAEVVVAGLDSWAEIPAGLDLVAAAALPLVTLTGAQLVEEAVNVQAGEVLLITGATGSVGRAAVFAALARGARVWAGVRAKNRADAEKLGVDGVVALDEEKDVARLPALDAIADTVRGVATEKLLAHLKKGGRIGSVVGEPTAAKERGIPVQAIFTRLDPVRLGQLARAAAEGNLAIPIARKFPLVQAADAQRFAAEGGPHGKVLLTM